jgi:hypothetical protein
MTLSRACTPLTYLLTDLLSHDFVASACTPSRHHATSPHARRCAMHGVYNAVLTPCHVRSSRHEIVPLTGQAGGGFLLDTNALHRAELHGVRERTAVLLEWHAHRKIQSLAPHPAVMALPCPSIKSAHARPNPSLDRHPDPHPAVTALPCPSTQRAHAWVMLDHVQRATHAAYACMVAQAVRGCGQAA